MVRAENPIGFDPLDGGIVQFWVTCRTGDADIGDPAVINVDRDYESIRLRILQRCKIAFAGF